MWKREWPSNSSRPVVYSDSNAPADIRAELNTSLRNRKFKLGPPAQHKRCIQIPRTKMRYFQMQIYSRRMNPDLRLPGVRPVFRVFAKDRSLRLALVNLPAPKDVRQTKAAQRSDRLKRTDAGENKDFSRENMERLCCLQRAFCL